MKTARITWTLELLQLVTSVPYLSARENCHQSESVLKRFLKEHFHKVAKKQHLGRTHQKRAVFLTGRAHKKMHPPFTVRNIAGNWGKKTVPEIERSSFTLC